MAAVAGIIFPAVSPSLSFFLPIQRKAHALHANAEPTNWHQAVMWGVA